MDWNRGDKFAHKRWGNDVDVKELGEIVDVSNGYINFKYKDCETVYCMVERNFNSFFLKCGCNKDIVIKDRVDDIIMQSTFDIKEVFNKCVIVSCLLPNGMVLVESYDFIDAGDYEQKQGVDICIKKIKDKIYEIERYKIGT